MQLKIENKLQCPPRPCPPCPCHIWNPWTPALQKYNIHWVFEALCIFFVCVCDTDSVFVFVFVCHWHRQMTAAIIPCPAVYDMFGLAWSWDDIKGLYSKSWSGFKLKLILEIYFLIKNWKLCVSLEIVNVPCLSVEKETETMANSLADG